MKNITTNIRHPFYETGDGISTMQTAVNEDANMSKDGSLKLLIAEVKAAHDAVHTHLTSNYNWD